MSGPIDKNTDPSAAPSAEAATGINPQDFERRFQEVSRRFDQIYRQIRSLDAEMIDLYAVFLALEKDLLTTKPSPPPKS